MRVAVFGGHGFVGSRVCRALNAEPYSRRNGVDALDIKTYPKGPFDAIVVTIGTPPLPFVDSAWQRRMNGLSNTLLLEHVEAPIKVLVNAAMPRWTPQGYQQGKLDALKSQATVVLKPSAIYGTRSGIPLTPLLAPISYLFRAVDLDQVSKDTVFENVLVPTVSVDSVVNAIVAACHGHIEAGSVLGPRDILKY